MGEHVMVWEYDDGILRGGVVCRAEEDADCRLGAADWSVCECESWNVERDERGSFHMVEGQRHDMKPTDYCNVELWINESDDKEEMYTGRFVIGETAINPVWMQDYYVWEPAS